MSADDRRDLLAQLEDRLDDSNRLHARFDKQSAFAGFPRLCSSTDPSTRKQKDSVDLEIRFTTYPGRREGAISFIRTFIIEEIEKQG
jgi:RNA binding exosome subunit